MKPQEVKVSSKGMIKVTLEDDTKQLEEVVVVGYGQQKKASVVGAITQTSGKTLERAGGVTSLGSALTGSCQELLLLLLLVCLVQKILNYHSYTELVE